MREIIACLAADGNNLVQNEDLSVQDREEKITSFSILQKARRDGMQCLRSGLDLNRSTDPYVMPGNREKPAVQGRWWQ